MTERHRQVTPDQVLEQNTGLDENRSDVGQNVPNGISRRGFLKLGLTAAVLAATEGMGLERVEAQEIPTGSDHGLKMYELCEREAGVYGVFNGSLVPMVMRETDDESGFEITVPIDLDTSFVYGKNGGLLVVDAGGAESVVSEFSHAAEQQILAIKGWGPNIRLEDLEISLLVNGGKAGMIFKTKRSLEIDGKSQSGGSVIVFQSGNIPLLLDKEEIVDSEIIVGEVGQQLAEWIRVNHGVTMASDELTIAQVDSLTNEPYKLLLDSQWISIQPKQETLRIGRRYEYLPTPDRLIPFLRREYFKNGLEGDVYKVYYSNAFMKDVIQLGSLRIREPQVMDSIWNYMLGEVHKQSGLEGLRIKLISLVQDTREGTKSDSGDIDMEVRNVTQYVVTEDEFNQIMQALKQKDRDYVFYQEWRSGGTQIGDNIIAYDAGNGDLVLIKQGQSLRGYSGEIMAAVQLPGALIMLTNSATWALGKRMDWQYNSDLSAQIYSYLGCTAMDAFCTTRGHFVEIE